MGRKTRFFIPETYRTAQGWLELKALCAVYHSAVVNSSTAHPATQVCIQEGHPCSA
ncbi:hypothetical protein CJA_3713 [Cellvibrio japonicus Ueda107]|uniref:Uncharacterized protein n=1 Tax=Cellvibrio japonicus (strain Ueda107) TaxID=498211 RepID=B3PHX0_CELJU|nr:hypothetical protein CJA_3713 [Cellvibrio japonicus Ueda107]